MRRGRVILASVVVATLGAALPLLVVFHLSWSFAAESERERLGIYADKVLDRAERSLIDATSALRSIEADIVEPCSAEHVGHMRRLTLATRTVDEIGYFEDGFLECTSWGAVEERVPRVEADLQMMDGVAGTLGVYPLANRDGSMVALQLGDHNVLVDPVRFVDVVAEPSMSLVLVGPAGRLVAAVNTVQPSRLTAILSDPEGAHQDDILFAVRARNGWTAVASEPDSQILAALRHEQAMLAPIGLAISTLIAALVYHLARKRLSPESELAHAVSNREFVAHYQPIVELASGRCVGAEALVRWRRPDGTLVRPDLFIPLAEESGLVLPITDQVVEAVVTDLGALLTTSPDLHVAINLSSRDVASGRVLPIIGACLFGSGIARGQIWLEATEHGFADIDPARQALQDARKAGHRIAIDDFGTGYSSLQYLQDLPIDVLKIDRSFVQTIGLASVGGAVILHIVDMGHALALEMVAEGVETEKQREFLVARGVQYGQGWLFGRAMPRDEFLAFVEFNRREAAEVRAPMIDPSELPA